MNFKGANLGILVGIVMMAMAFTMFPIILDGANEILTHTAIASFTGLDSLVSIGPTLIFVFLLFGGIGLSGYSGYRAVRKRRAGGGNSSNSTRY